MPRRITRKLGALSADDRLGLLDHEHTLDPLECPLSWRVTTGPAGPFPEEALGVRLMKRVEADRYLEAVDELLEPLAFRRKKPGQEWRRVVDPNHTDWIHLNFGLADINSSLGVSYTDLSTLLPANISATVGTIVMLSSITGRSYSSSDEPLVVANALFAALPTLDRLRDRAAMIEALKSADPADWRDMCVSTRMRLLPLLLASVGRSSEACDWLTRFETVALQCDQILPRYDEFARHLRIRLQAI